jgi:hypothetical protein
MAIHYGHIWPYIYGHYGYGNLKISFHIWSYYGMVWPYMVIHPS